MTLTLPLQQTEVQAYEALTCKHFDYKSTIEAINKLLTYNDRKPKGLLVTGVAGVGKTFIAEQTERALSASDTKELSTIPVIYIDASHYTSVGDVLSEMLNKLGDPKPYTGTIGNKDARACRYFKSLEVKLVIIDEVQDLLPKRGTTPNSKIYKFLKSFLNKCGVPFLLLGTESSPTLFADDQLRTRFLPTQHIRQFSCLGKNNTINFGLIVEMMAENLPRKSSGLIFCKAIELENGKAGYELKREHKILLRLCLATRGLMRSLSDLLTECILITKPNERVDINVLAKACDNVLNTDFNFNPFDSKINITMIKDELIMENLYAK